MEGRLLRFDRPTAAAAASTHPASPHSRRLRRTLRHGRYVTRTTEGIARYAFPFRFRELETRGLGRDQGLKTPCRSHGTVSAAERCQKAWYQPGTAGVSIPTRQCINP